MSGDPLFSVVIPTLNEEKALPLLLRDIVSQKYTSVEICVVDAQSTDKTRHVVQLVEKKSKVRLTCIISHKRGAAVQRNVGVQHSRGRFVIFLDADARLPVHFFHDLQKQIDKYPGFLYTTYLASYDQRATQDVLLLDTTNVLLEVVNTIGRPFAAGTSIIIDRYVFLRIGGFNTSLHLAEDHELVQRAKKAGVGMRVLPKPVIYFSMRRPKQIGYLRFLTQYSVSGLQTFFGKEQKKPLFDYPMGGEMYSQQKKSEWSVTDIKSIRTFAKNAAKSVGARLSK